MKKSNESRNAETTRRLILNAAESIFADKGFAGATIRDISEKSGASGPLILFHFKDKKGIYEAVKASIVQRYVDSHHKHAPSRDVSRFSITHWVGAMFAFYRDNPTMVRLANWARLAGDMEPWPGEDEWHHVYLDHIREAQLRGEIRNDLSPLNISIMICGAIHIWWEYHAHFIKHLKAENHPGNADDRYLSQCISFVLKGLCTEPQPNRLHETHG